MTRTAQPAKLLDELAFPTRDVGDEFFKNTRSAGAPAVVDRLRYIDSTRARIQRRNQSSGDKFADDMERPNPHTDQ